MGNRLKDLPLIISIQMLANTRCNSKRLIWMEILQRPPKPSSSKQNLLHLTRRQKNLSHLPLRRLIEPLGLAQKLLALIFNLVLIELV